MMSNAPAPRRFSLLSSRSLGNLQSEFPPPAISPKSARRAQRIFTGPGGVVTMISASSSRPHDEPDDHSEPTSSPMISFQDAAAMFIDSDSSIISESTRQRSLDPRKLVRMARSSFGLRCEAAFEPPVVRVNPSPGIRRDRTPTISSPSSTPLTVSDAYTASDTSSLQGLVGFASEFPQPPSLSPALRKMQSVPWLKNDGSDLVPSRTEPALPLSRSHYCLPNSISDSVDRVRPFLPPTRPEDIQILQSDSVSSYGSSALSQRTRQRTAGALDFDRVGEPHVEPNVTSSKPRPRAFELDHGQRLEHINKNSWANRSNHKTWTTDDLLQWSVPNRMRESLDGSQFPARPRHGQDLGHRRPMIARPHLDNRRYTMCARPEEAIIEEPRTIRKVASMQARSREQHKQRPIQKIKSLRLFPSSNSSKQDLAKLNTETKSRGWLFSRSSHRQGAYSVDYAITESASAPIKPPPTRTPYPSVSMQEVSSIASRPTKNKKKPAPTSNGRDSRVWLSGLGFSNYEFPHPKPLPSKERGEGTYHYQNIRLAAAKSHGNLPDTLDSSMSFMSIERSMSGMGPPQGRERSEKKTKVQKLIARASVGFLEWGKNLTGRRQPHSP